MLRVFVILWWTIIDEFDKDTKFIVHSARVDQGSSGGPLFDADGGIIGLNTMISDSAAENIAVSADHIRIYYMEISFKKILKQKKFFLLILFSIVFIFSTIDLNAHPSKKHKPMVCILEEDRTEDQKEHVDNGYLFIVYVS